MEQQPQQSTVPGPNTSYPANYLPGAYALTNSTPSHLLGYSNFGAFPYPEPNRNYPPRHRRPRQSSANRASTSRQQEDTIKLLSEKIEALTKLAEKPRSRSAGSANRDNNNTPKRKNKDSDAPRTLKTKPLGNSSKVTFKTGIETHKLSVSNKVTVSRNFVQSNGRHFLVETHVREVFDTSEAISKVRQVVEPSTFAGLFTKEYFDGLVFL